MRVGLNDQLKRFSTVKSLNSLAVKSTKATWIRPESIIE